ncbi:MAG TPA: polysaccharide deacetylase family protein [Solirubrobacteraceae bacterium]|nr:polysaccharide deacetylase family protein [Solirubrobacteraceae bacterium]
MRLRPISGAIALLAVLVGSAGAAGSVAAPAPLRVESSSVDQDRQQIVWSVRTTGRFSAAGLHAAHTSLCLLIERVRRASAVGELCLAPGKHAPLLVYLKATGDEFGMGRVVAATITRTGAYEMTATFLPARFDPGYQSFRWQVVSSVRATGCVGAAGSNCHTSFPTHAALARVHVPKLVGCAPSGPSLVYGGPSTHREIALTFDDGPWPQPPSIDFVNLLARYHVPATFFEIGNQLSEYDPTGSVERKMLADGDMIGNHTWTHPNMNALSPSAQTSELTMTTDAIRRATGGFSPCLWRSPYGLANPSLIALARSLGMITVMWNIDPRDWALPGVGAIEGNVLTNARNGGIVEMHFGGGPRYETIDSLPTIINTLRARGYRFVNLAQMLGLRLIYK